MICCRPTAHPLQYTVDHERGYKNTRSMLPAGCEYCAQATAGTAVIATPEVRFLCWTSDGPLRRTSQYAT